MNAIGDRFFREILLTAIVALGLAGFAGYRLFYQPAALGVAAAESRLAGLRQVDFDTGESGDAERNLAAERRLADHRQTLARLEARIPTRGGLLDLVDSVAMAAVAADVEVTLLQPLEGVGDEAYQPVGYVVGALGSYRGIVEFVSGVASLSWILSPTELRISPARIVTDPENRLVEAAFTLKTYVHASDSPISDAETRR